MAPEIRAAVMMANVALVRHEEEMGNRAPLRGCEVDAAQERVGQPAEETASPGAKASE